MSTGTHVTHCCDKHGCKYGDADCPVVRQTHKQQYPCETCGTCNKSDGGYYEKAKNGRLVWHPYLFEIVLRVAKQLGVDGKGKLTKKALSDLQFAALKLKSPRDDFWGPPG
jgi:hypothetical protein